MCTKCFNKNQPGSLLFPAGDYLQRHQAGEHPGGRVRSHSADRFRPQQGTAPRRQRTKGVLVLRHDRVHGPGSGQGRHPGTRYRKYKTLSITHNCLSMKLDLLSQVLPLIFILEINLLSLTIDILSGLRYRNKVRS